MEMGEKDKKKEIIGQVTALSAKLGKREMERK